MTHTNAVAGTGTEVELVITYPEFVEYVELRSNSESLAFKVNKSDRKIGVTYPVQGEKGSAQITFVLAATGLSHAKSDPLNDIIAAFPNDVLNKENNESRVEVTAVNVTPTPTATPTATVTPMAPPTAPPTPTVPSLPTARPTVPPTPAPTTPTPRATSQLDVSVRVAAATSPAIVGGDVVIETTTTNVGAETAGPVVLANVMPSFLQLVEVRSDDLTGYYDVENGTVVVTHPRLAPGRSITTYIVARAVAVSGPQGAATNNNVVSVYADEYGYERTIADDEEMTEIIVATASSTTTGKTTTTTTGKTITTTTGSQTTASAAPTALPNPPASLPDTGAGTTTSVLVLAAGMLLGAGVAAQAMLRRRTR
jgi:LPXTG-motif cell wall-anchored protein